MGLKRFVDKAEVEKMILKCNKYDEMLNEIVKGLQANQGQYAEIDVNDVVPLNNRLKYMKRTGILSYDYQHLRIFKLKNSDNSVTAFIKWTEQIDEPKLTKKRTRKKQENTPENKQKNNTNTQQ
jgi:hypothetical protein